MKELLLYIYDTCVITEVSLLTWWVNSEEEYCVKTVAETLNPVHTLEGIILLPEQRIQDIKSIEHIIGMIFPGGVNISLSKPLENLIVKLHQEKKIFGAICAGPTFLAYAGVLKGKKYITTRTPERFNELKMPDPFEWENKQPEQMRVIRDGNLITATGVAFTDFTDVLFGALNLYRGEEDRKAILEDFNPQWKF